MNTCEAAPESELRAFFVPGSPSVRPQLFLSARGTVSDSCWTVSIRMSPLRVWPPEFLIEACRLPDGCLDVETDFDVTEGFEIGTRPEEVVVRDAAGPHTVPVEVVPDRAAVAPPSNEANDEATGVSVGAASLSDALSDAARKLYPDQQPNVPRSIRMLDVTYSEGGVMPPVLSVRATRA